VVCDSDEFLRFFEDLSIKNVFEGFERAIDDAEVLEILLHELALRLVVV